jgi:tetratricopeptide (TPR) repeat protein
VLLAALVIAVYVPILRADFVNWDDDSHVLENACVTEPAGLWPCWREWRPAGYYPLTWTTFHVEWRLGHGQPWLFHLDNVLLHAANAVLVGHLAARLGLPAAASLGVAALWALHPMQVGSVAWVTERKNMLFVCLWLAALLLYLRAGPAAYAASLVVFVLALLSKSAAVTLPAAIVVVAWARGRRLDRWFWLSLLPYAGLGLAGGLAQIGAVPVEHATPPLAIRLPIAARAAWFYVGKFLWPLPLVPIYPRWSTEAVGAAEYLSLGAAVVAVATLGVAHRHVPRTFLAGLGFWAVNAAPVVGLVWFTYFTHSIVSDHLAYLPSVGLALAAVVGLHALLGGSRVATALLAVWCAALAVLTWRQLPVWRDSETLWAYNRAHYPGCFVCALNLGNVRLDQGRLEEATALYEEAARLEPHNEKAHYNLGNVLTQRGSLDEAIARYRDALVLHPESVDIHINLGVALAHAERIDEAEAEFRETLRLAPRDPTAHVNLAELAAMRGDWAAAIPHYEAALESRPDHLGARQGLASVLDSAGRVGDAVRVLREGLERLPDAAGLAGGLAWIRATTPAPEWRNGAEAVALAERACALTGNGDADLLDTLAAAYAEAGRFEDALRTARQALALAEPGSPVAEGVTRRIALYEAGQPYRDE